MNISNRGLQAIVQREGVILHAYKDSVGVWTIGTGHTSAAGPPKVTSGMVITKDQNDTILRQDLAPIEEQAAQYIKVPVTQNQYDAIISVVFNVGPKFWKSTSMRKLNAGDYQGAADALLMWNKPPEIIGRRQSERTQFLTPDPKIVPTVSAAGAGIGAGIFAHYFDLIKAHPYISIAAVAGITLVIYAAVHFLRKKN